MGIFFARKNLRFLANIGSVHVARTKLKTINIFSKMKTKAGKKKAHAHWYDREDGNKVQAKKSRPRRNVHFQEDDYPGAHFDLSMLKGNTDYL